MESMPALASSPGCPEQSWVCRRLLSVSTGILIIYARCCFLVALPIRVTQLFVTYVSEVDGIDLET